jgi:hypothetical protein
MSHKMLIFKAGINFFIPCRQLQYALHVGYVLIQRGVFPQHTAYDDESSENFISFTWNLCLQESVPQTELISHKEFSWNRCLGSLKVKKLGLWSLSS